MRVKKEIKRKKRESWLSFSNALFCVEGGRGQMSSLKRGGLEEKTRKREYLRQEDEKKREGQRGNAGGNHLIGPLRIFKFG